MAVPDYRQALTDQLDAALLSRFRVSRSMRSWIDPFITSRGLVDADVAAGIQIRVLHRLVRIPHREIRLARGEYAFESDERNAAHLYNELQGQRPEGYGDDFYAWCDWKPEWREGYG